MYVIKVTICRIEWLKQRQLVTMASNSFGRSAQKGSSGFRVGPYHRHPMMKHPERMLQGFQIRQRIARHH